MSESSERKSKPATSQKLKKSRRDGTVAQSQKSIGLLVSSSLFFLILIGLRGALGSLSDEFSEIFPLIGKNFNQTWDNGVHIALHHVLKDVGVLFLVAFVVATSGSIVFHRGIPFSIKPIIPNSNRLSPVQGVKRIFGRKSLAEFASGLFQLTLWGVLSSVLVRSAIDQFFSLSFCSISCWGKISWLLLQKILISAIIFCIVFMIFEIFLQLTLYSREQRMTLSEFNREKKDSFGSPEIRRARQKLLQQDRLFDEVDQGAIGMDQANMCFYYGRSAVGIRYHPEIAPVPYISFTAREEAGTQELRSAVRSNGFPEQEHQLIAEACAKRPNGTPVPSSLYRVLGQAIMSIYHS